MFSRLAAERSPAGGIGGRHRHEATGLGATCEFRNPCYHKALTDHGSANADCRPLIADLGGPTLNAPPRRPRMETMPAPSVSSAVQQLGDGPLRVAPQPGLRPWAADRGLAGRAVHPAAAPGVCRQGDAVSALLLPDRHLGLPRPRAGDRHPLLPGRPAAGPDRGGADRRDRGRADGDDAAASRGGPYRSATPIGCGRSPAGPRSLARSRSPTARSSTPSRRAASSSATSIPASTGGPTPKSTPTRISPRRSPSGSRRGRTGGGGTITGRP